LADRPLLRRRPVLALLAAEVVSTTGSQMTWLALPWFVLVTSGSATRMSLVVAGELIGLAAFGVPGGKLLGRIGARQTMLLCDAARAPVMVALPILHWAGALSFGFVLAAAVVLGALTAPYFAAQRMIVPELLGEDERLVSKAAALFQGATRVTLLLGPVVAGLLIAALSAPAVLVVDAATYVVAVALVAGFVPRRPPVEAGAEEGERSLRAGLRFLRRERLLRVWMPLFALGDAAWAGFFVAVPVLVVTRFGADPRIAGLLLASFGAGAVVGNVISYRALVGRFDGLGIIAVCIMGQALPLWLLTGSFPPAVYSAALLLSGLANGLVNPSIHALMVLRVPVSLRPTVMTSMTTFFGLVQPLGVLGVGPVLDAFGPEPVLVAFAATQTVMMAAVGLVSLRERPSERRRLAVDGA
jgi:predicted MFS family arabinose efflux permease